MIKFAAYVALVIVASAISVQAACVIDPAPNETTCGYEARMTVARRHGFVDMAHANMSEAIAGSASLNGEADMIYSACMKYHNFCSPQTKVRK